MTIYSTKIGIIQQKFDLFNKFGEEFNKSGFSFSKYPSLAVSYVIKKEDGLLHLLTLLSVPST
jgi:hypothetical protein